MVSDDVNLKRMAAILALVPHARRIKAGDLEVEMGPAPFALPVSVTTTSSADVALPAFSCACHHAEHEHDQHRLCLHGCTSCGKAAAP